MAQTKSGLDILALAVLAGDPQAEAGGYIPHAADGGAAFAA
jgi:hypothetical protein